MSPQLREEFRDDARTPVAPPDADRYRRTLRSRGRIVSCQSPLFGITRRRRDRRNPQPSPRPTGQTCHPPRPPQPLVGADTSLAQHLLRGLRNRALCGEFRKLISLRFLTASESRGRSHTQSPELTVDFLRFPRHDQDFTGNSWPRLVEWGSCSSECPQRKPVCSGRKACAILTEMAAA